MSFHIYKLDQPLILLYTTNLIICQLFSIRTHVIN